MSSRGIDSAAQLEFGVAAQEQEPIVRARDYLSLLWIVAAAVLGMSLLCGVAAVGINDINHAALIGTPTVGIVNFVISNMNTMIVATPQVFSQPQLLITLAPSATNTGTPIPTGTHVIIHLLPNGSTPQNFIPGGVASQTQIATSSATPLVIPSHTPLPPTSTNTPIPTHTLIPTLTSTPIPDTDTPVPDTDTPIPPTLTPIPDTPVPDTDTPIPPPTPIPDTPVPDTDTPGP